MIPEKIQFLFDFIDYLDSNKKVYIEKYVPISNELQSLFSQKFKLNADKNYAERRQSNEIQAQINEISLPLKANVCAPISEKLKELGIWAGDKEYSSIWNNNIKAISEFKMNFKSEDVDEVINYKTKYLKFRADTGTDFLYLKLIFYSLDEILKQLFDYFKDSDSNEFETFEAKTIVVENIEELAKSIRENIDQNVKFTLPSNNLYDSNKVKPSQVKTQNISSEVIMGDKIQIGDISNKNGQVTVGKNISSNESNSDSLTKKSFNWQKWGIIIGTILALAAILIPILIT